MYVQFMCTGTFVCSEEVGAVVLADAPSSLTYSYAELKEAIKSLNIGDTNTSKDFLDPTASTLKSDYRCCEGKRSKKGCR